MTATEMRGTSRWQKWARRSALALAGVALALGCIVWRWGWWAPPEYTPGMVPRAAVAIDTSIHDPRVSRLGKDDAYILHIETQRADSKSGALLFFGSLHTKDTAHPQMSALSRAWEEFHPTVALVEGRMGFFVGTATQGVGVFGEGAAVYARAEDAGIPIYTLEPPLAVEVEALGAIGDRTQVGLFRVLSGYMSARRGGPVSDFKIGRLLSKRAAPLTDALPTIAALDAEFARLVPEYDGWRDMPEEAMWPGRTDTWLNLMATRGNEVRDEHFVRVMLDLVERGERVLAIAGRSHTVVLEPVLWESMQPAERGLLSSPRPWEGN